MAKIMSVDQASLALTAKQFKRLKRAMGGRANRKRWLDMFQPAAEHMKRGLQSTAPRFHRVHYAPLSGIAKTYKRRGGGIAKLSERYAKARKIHPGNLRRGQKIMRKFRKSRSLFVGSKYAFGRASSMREHRTVGQADPFYAHMLEKGANRRHSVLPRNRFTHRATKLYGRTAARFSKIRAGRYIREEVRRISRG